MNSKRFKHIVLMLSMVIFAVGCMKTTACAETMRATDVSEASEGNVLLGIRGTYLSATKEQILNRVNAIRKEACDKGYLNPDTGGRLTSADYVPIRWSSDLEWIAQIRAVEATVCEDHYRPNGEICFSLMHNNVGTYGENLAWNFSGIMDGIEQWYDEKDDWVNQTGYVTGHYTSMISPSNTYIGIGGFVRESGGWCAVAGEFSCEDGLDESKSVLQGSCIQIIEVSKSAVSAPVVSGELSVVAGKTSQLSLTFDICYEGIMGGSNISEGLPLGATTWSSSNTNVADVSSTGKVTAKSVGTTTIVANNSTGISASCIFSVKAPSKGTKIKSGAVTYKVTKAGSTVEYCRTAGTSKTVSIPATVKINGVKYNVTSIAASAFKNNKKITKVTIGSNISTIGKDAFRGCKNLKSIVIKTKKLKTGTVKSNAFKGIYSKTKIKVPATKLKSYRILLKKRGIGSKATIKK